MASYHLFQDHAALAAPVAVAVAGFGQLFESRQAALATAGESLAARLVARMRSYVGFVVGRPELYRRMGSPELANRSAYPALAAAAAAPAASLRAMVAAAQAAG